MVTQQHVGFETQEGLNDDYVVWIGHAVFGYRDNYKNRETGELQPLLIWTDLWSPDLPPDDVDREIVWSIGKGWGIGPDGKIVTPASKKSEKGFITTSMYGRLINRVIKDLKVPVSSLGASPAEAQIWIGQGFHMLRQELKFEGMETSERKRLMPVRYMGRKTPEEMRALIGMRTGATIAAPVADGFSTAPVPPVSTTVVAPVPVTPVANPARENVLVLAKSLKAGGKTRADFQSAALSVSGVAIDPALLNEVLSEKFWNEA